MIWGCYAMSVLSNVVTLTEQIGGPVVALLLALSCIALALIFARLLFSLRLAVARRPTPAQCLNSIEQQGTLPAQAVANQNAFRLDPRLANIRDTWEACQDLTGEDARSEALRRLRNRTQHTASGLRPLEVIATVSPLLGLFGTVLGMIEAFRAMEAAGAQVDPSVLSGGIWEALLTTAVGLGVAIPVSLIHSLLERRHEMLATHMLSDTEWLLTHEPADAPASPTLKAVGA